MADIYVATSSFVVDLDGRRYVAHKGRTTIEAGHPLLEARPGSFRPQVADIRLPGNAGGVEQATAAPGERRDAPDLTERKATSKKAAAKKATAKKATAKKTAARKPADDAEDDADDTAEGAADAPTAEPEAEPGKAGSTADDE